MKKLLLTLSFIVAGVGLSQAQKRTTEVAGLYYTILPQQQLDENLKRYQPVLNTPLFTLTYEEENQAKAGVPSYKRPEAIQKAAEEKKPKLAMQYLTFPSSKLVAVTSEEDFTVDLTTSDITVSYIAENITDLEDTDIVVRYSYNATLRVTDAEGAVIFEKDVHQPVENQVIKKAELFFNPKTYVKFRMARKPEKKRKHIENLLESYERQILQVTLESAKTALKEEFFEEGKSVQVHISAGKKKYDYTQLEETQELIESTFDALTSLRKKKRMTDEQVSENLKVAMALWESELAQEDASNEEARINTEIADGLRMNMVVAFIWFKEFDKAMNLLDQVEDSKPKEGEWISQGSFKFNAQKLREALTEIIEKKDRVEIDNIGREAKS